VEHIRFGREHEFGTSSEILATTVAIRAVLIGSAFFVEAVAQLRCATPLSRVWFPFGFGSDRAE